MFPPRGVTYGHRFVMVVNMNRPRRLAPGPEDVTAMTPLAPQPSTSAAPCATIRAWGPVGRSATTPGWMLLFGRRP
jgi:hypothetical protein